MDNVMGGGAGDKVFSKVRGDPPPNTHLCRLGFLQEHCQLWVNYSLGEKAAEAGLLGGELTPRLSWGNSRIPTEAGVRRDSPL